MKIFNYLFFFLVFNQINCYQANRQFELIQNKKNFENVKVVHVSTDINEIRINRKWGQKSYLNPSSLNSYTIYLNNEEFKVYLRNKLQEKLAESDLNKDKNVIVKLNFTEITYLIEKDSGIFFPMDSYFINLKAKIIILFDKQKKEINYELIPTFKNKSNGLPLLSWSGSQGLFRAAKVNPPFSGLGATVITTLIHYFIGKNEKIEKYLDNDLDQFGYFLRDKLEFLEFKNNKKKFHFTD